MNKPPPDSAEVYSSKVVSGAKSKSKYYIRYSKCKYI